MNTGEVYVSMSYASIKKGLCVTGISEACKGLYKRCGKDKEGDALVWRYKEEYKKMSEDEKR